jgi:hypothetical protein
MALAISSKLFSLKSHPLLVQCYYKRKYLENTWCRKREKTLTYVTAVKSSCAKHCISIP